MTRGVQETARRSQTGSARLLVVTGKGGVGKTTVAAATATRCASLGWRTLVISTDAAHSLADSFEKHIGPEPVEIASNLWGQQLDGRRQMEGSWTEIRTYLAELLGWAGADGLTADELLVVPGMQEVFALENILTQVESGSFDRIVVDCAPTAETLRLLELPEVLDWYLERVFPTHRRIANMARPILRRATDMPLATDAVMDAFVRFVDRLRSVRDVLADPKRSTVRIVTTAEQLVVAESRRLYAHLGLFGYNVDSIVVNRLLPPSERGTTLLDHWQQRQAEQLLAIEDSFTGIPLRSLHCEPLEPLGLERLEQAAAQLYGDVDPIGGEHADPAIEFHRGKDHVELRVRLPGFERAEVAMRRRGPDLLVTAGSERRALSLPESLRDRPHVGARYDGRDLVIQFETARDEAAHGLIGVS